MKRLRILTWHVHGSYLYYLTQLPHEFYLPSKPDRSGGYAGKFGHIPWGPNVHDVPVDQLKSQSFDCVIYQWRDHYFKDQYVYLSGEQQRLPRIYLEHDPPQQHPTFTKHPVDDPATLLVHVTPFNQLMWDSGRTPTRVIEHGVIVPDGLKYSGHLARGLVVINHLGPRGRRLGSDLYLQVREVVPLDLIGMAAEELGGLGEVLHKDIPAFATSYRFFFHPARYTSLGLAVIEAMMAGLPIIAPATTEIVTVIQNGINGYIDTRVDVLIERMKELLANRREAQRLGENAARTARERFNINRFIEDWNRALAEITTEQLVC